jgi:hypothetical protein
MAHEDQFTATGPPLSGSGKPFSAFSSKATGMVYGLNVQGNRCGVYGESVTVDSQRESDVEGVGVHGFGQGFGIFGNGNPGIAGVYGQNNRGRIGAIGAVMRGGTGVVGANLSSLGNPLSTWGSIPSTSEGGSGTGVHGLSGTGTGVFGQSAGGFGVHGQSDTRLGVHGRCLGSNTGVFGLSGPDQAENDPNIRTGFGVHGHSPNSVGVHGSSRRHSGVDGFSRNATGVFGHSETGFGVHGASTNSRAVFGDDPGGNGVGVWGTSQNGVGVLGESDNGTAGRFEGFVEVLGDLRVDGDKAFRIDHPLDPENKYLLHNAVESSERKNVYDGVAQLDEDGSAWVDLPEWFEALNGDFRYQLTAIGEAAPNLHVAEEISESRFKIAGGEGGMKVCWQATGSRRDPWAAANPFVVEEEKPEEKRGLYLEPGLYDAPEEQSVITGRM